MSSYGLLLILIAGIAMMITLCVAAVYILILANSYNYILFNDCDSIKFLEYMTYAFEYGKQTYLKSYPKLLAIAFEDHYIKALLANNQLDAAEYAVNHSYGLKKRQKDAHLWYIQLKRAYKSKNTDTYNALYNSVKFPHRKTNVLTAQKFYLEKNYSEALLYLEKDKKPNVYRRVYNSFYCAQCYLALSEYHKATGALQFTVVNANTLPIKEKAAALLDSLPPLNVISK